MSAGNSAYSPLPQSNSDSDCSSEEELHVSQGNRVVNRTAKVQNSKSEKTCNEQKNNIINYNLLDNDGDVGIALNKFQSNPDEVSILKPETGLEIFSTCRKICFVFSLLLCIFTTVAFIWILPCNVEPCQSASELNNYNFSWEQNLPNLDIHGPITLVYNKENESNLLFLTKSFLDSEKIPKNGVMCLKGRDGSSRWNVSLDGEPTDIDCKLIDINTDSIQDCLIHGKNFLQAINPVSGEELWDVQKSNAIGAKLHFQDFPLVIPDVDADKVNDLLLPSAFSTGKKGDQNNLVIISGKTGRVINSPLQMKSCSSIHNLLLERSLELSFTCFNSNEKESFQKINFMTVVQTVKTLPIKNTNLPKWDLLKQHTGYSDSVNVDGFRLILENHGDCPEDCVVLVSIKDGNAKSNNKTVYQLKKENTFGMSPVVLKTKTETGFLLKLWKWSSKTENSNLQNDRKLFARNVAVINNFIKNLTRRSKKVNHLLNDSKILDKEMMLESEWESQRKKRTAIKLPRFGRNVLKGDTTSLHLITETIVKISLNRSEFLLSNITKGDIIQICDKPNICRPNPYQHRHSVVVAPLDGNGSEKLITFTSKYVYKNKETKNNLSPWHIHSTVQVLNV